LYRDEIAWLRSWEEPTLQLVRAHKKVTNQSIIILYEDLVSDPVSTLSIMFKRLGLESGEGLVSTIVAHVEALGLTNHAVHATTARGEAMKSRWRDAMSDEEKGVARESLGAQLEYFGYQLE
jgi:hypothetical protein